MTSLLFFCGHAGTGKTTLAKKLLGPLMRASAQPFCLLDKDTLYGGYSAAAMAMLTGDPNDRDSPLFLEHLRDPEYRGLIDTARDNLQLGVSAIAVAPLSREVRERRLFDRAWLGIGEDITLRVVWVHTSDEVARQRIVARGDPNDAYKLANWDDYRQRRFVPNDDIRGELLMFNNTAPSGADHDALLERLIGDAGAPPVTLRPLPV
ncbi:ATP-binding protein [Paraburkholderia sp. D15]|uniref:AAA family ATPase n=1 Tax=Paraburkholderia sp. D15 TaxID=2880218 RepID=UPI0024791D30|nr:ATP-binding protein [Paraburkholderia sp. D15]WGS51504.1 ATP-binding protein [Paraburkholderia sp. D15]